MLYLRSHPNLTLTVLSSLGKIRVSDEFTQGLPYKAAKPLLQTSGLAWSYQPASGMYELLRERLLVSYKNYQEGSKDKLHHPLYLFLSGVGTGKSRHASEFHKSVVKCLGDDNSELQNRLKDAWVFHVSLENGTSLKAEEKDPFKAI